MSRKNSKECFVIGCDEQWYIDMANGQVERESLCARDNDDSKLNV